MTDYEADPRVTQVGDDDYQITIEGQGPWRVYRDGDRWFSGSPNVLPFHEGPSTYEHPSKEEAFAAMLNPNGGKVIVPARNSGQAGGN